MTREARTAPVHAWRQQVWHRGAVQLPFADEVRESLRESRVVRGALVETFRRLIRLYFRDIERLGVAPGADTHGRVFVANHSNGLIDPVVVMTEAECEISPVAKSTLWSIPVLNWILDRAGAVPIIRRKDTPDKDASTNAGLFDKIAAHLSGGGNILIFPEGTSHSQPKLAPFRTGAARMLAAAAELSAERSGVPPTFQAVALEFDARTEFRSRCLVLWGPVRRFADLPGDGEERIQAATAQMKTDLEELLVEGETSEDRLRIARVAELLADDDGDRSLGRWSNIGRRVEVASKTLRTVDDTLVARVAERVDAYYGELERLGVEDAQVVGGRRIEPEHDEESTLRRWLRAPLAASGVALYALPYFIPRLIANRVDPDERSSVKLGASLVVYPLWAAGLVAGSFVLLPPPLSFVGATVAVTSPFAALRWLDKQYQRRREPTSNELAQLARLRIAARTAIDDARRQLPP